MMMMTMMHCQQRMSSKFVRYSSSASRSSQFPMILSVLGWSVTLLLIVSWVGVADAERSVGHSLYERLFEDECTGNFDNSIFARLNRICDDCYNMYKVAKVYTGCMKGCFTSDVFQKCVEGLYLEAQIPHIKNWIRQIHRGRPDLN